MVFARYVNDALKTLIFWFDTLLSLKRENFTHFIMEFKIDEVVSFVHARISVIFKFLNRRLVQFELYQVRVSFDHFYQ